MPTSAAVAQPFRQHRDQQRTMEELPRTGVTTDSASDAEESKLNSGGSEQTDQVSESLKLIDTEVASILSEKCRKMEEMSRKRAAETAR